MFKKYLKATTFWLKYIIQSLIALSSIYAKQNMGFNTLNYLRFETKFGFKYVVLNSGTCLLKVSKTLS